MTTVLCIASYEKGAEFMRECRRLGAHILFLTSERLRDADWPRDAIDAFYYLPSFGSRQEVLNAASYLARARKIDRIVALDEFDQEMAAELREHLRVPGMGQTTVRRFRDKLAMRQAAAEAGIPVPSFTAAFHDEEVRAWLARVPGPWLLKPRGSAAAIGIRKVEREEQVWQAFEALGDLRADHLLERFVPGSVCHVDAIVNEGRVVFDSAHAYADTPFQVAHAGGLFCSRSLERDSPEEVRLLNLNREVVTELGMVRGVVHTEFIRSEADGRLVFLETAARVGGAHIVDLVEAATGANLWREWARLEIAHARGEAYSPPARGEAYAGILISLARQEQPDTSAFDDAEIVWRMNKRHHAGLIVASRDPDRVRALLDNYMPRFRDAFMAFMPAPDRPTA